MMRVSALRKTLKAGSLVFGGSAIFLLAAPGVFLDLMALDSSDQMQWSMRMIAITVFALAGNMWNNSGQSSVDRVVNVARVMFISALTLGILTLMVPVELTWFTYIYAAIGFGFAISYLMNLIRK
jgi:heme A synthase